MNESSSKKLLFNKSSLLSLKAELIRKQEEVQGKKHLPQYKAENFKPSASKTVSKDDEKPGKKSFKERLKEIDAEELEACRKSKDALERKAQLYDHLSDGAGTSKLTSNFLVDFANKKQQEQPQLQSDDEINDDHNVQDTEDDDWVEFTDCLGRTRKCHKSDLHFFESKNEDLKKIQQQKGHALSTPKSAEEQDTPTEKPLLVQKTNDYLKSLREKWEQQENELIAKKQDIHYQDILFDEARMHGVGYFSFSNDETERNKQMEELMKRRKETEEAQKLAEEKRKKRDELIAGRLAAAKARKRMREGLPPEDPEEAKETFTKRLLELLNKQKNEADAKAKEEERKLKEEQEKERQKLREAYVREWDIGKDGVEPKNAFREMTQEEYVEQQRDKRIADFAPPSETKKRKTDAVFDEKGRIMSEKEPSKPKTWADVRPMVEMEAPPPPIFETTSSANKGLYFSSSSKSDRGTMKYKNFVKEQKPVPIINELDDEENEPEREYENRDAKSFKRSEIAPPPTYDYYGPVPTRSKAPKPFDLDVSEAYEQGVKSLAPKESKRQLSKDYDFML